MQSLNNDEVDSLREAAIGNDYRGHSEDTRNNAEAVIEGATNKAVSHVTEGVVEFLDGRNALEESK